MAGLAHVVEMLAARPALSLASSILPSSASSSSASRAAAISGCFAPRAGIAERRLGHRGNGASGCCARDNSRDLGVSGGRDLFSMAAASQTTPVGENAEFAIQDRILAHQKRAAKLSPVEDARTLVYQSGLGTLSTISKKYDGSPVGSMVSFAADEDGSIILSISSLAPHTQNLEFDPKCSLLVPRDPTDKSDTIVTIIGQAHTISDQNATAARDTFLKKHPEASWVDFGDFRFVRIQPKAIKYTSGLATGLASVAEFTQEQFQGAKIDPISQFAVPIAGHMNRDHAAQTAQIVENSIGVKVDSALIEEVDRFGFGVKAEREGETMKLRIPFPRPAEDRKAVKTLIVEMLGSKET